MWFFSVMIRVLPKEQRGKKMERNDEFYMKRAIELAASAVEHGNEPFGAVLVRDGEIIFENENQIYSAHDPTFHAEMGLIRRYCAESAVTDLSDCTLYSSCEPCFMCCGAMVWTKLGGLVYGASDIELCQILGVQGAECCRTVFEASGKPSEVKGGVLREESLALLQDYFSGHDKG